MHRQATSAGIALLIRLANFMADGGTPPCTTSIRRLQHICREQRRSITAVLQQRLNGMAQFCVIHSGGLTAA
jgi:hypothetical protein